MKKFLALLLALVMLLSLAACVQEKPEETKNPGNNETPKQTQPKETDPKPKEEVTLRYFYMNQAGEQQYTADVEKKLNEILDTIPGYEHINMDLVPCNDYATEFTLAQTAGDQIDLVSTYGLDMTSMVKNGDFIELSDLLAKYPNVTSEIPEWLVKMGIVFDGMYYVPTYQQAANMNFWMTTTEYADMYRAKYGKTKEDMTNLFYYGTLEEKLDFAEDMVEAVREGTGKDTKWMHVSFSVTRFFNAEYIGVDYGPIFLIEGQDAPIWWTYSDEYYTVYKRLNEWYKKGYIHPDVTTYKASDYNGKNMLNDESHVFAFGQNAVSAETYSTNTSNSYGFPVEYYQVTDHAYIPSKWAAGGNAIYADCAHPEEAMMIIELLMTEKGKEFYSTLVWGLEDIHWKWVDKENEKIETLEYAGSQGDATCSYHAWMWNIGNTFNIWQNQSFTPGFNDYLLNEIHNGEKTVASPATGITWDLSSVQDQIAQCTAVNKEYGGIYTQDNFEEVYQEFRAKLEAAGVKDILKCLKDQYDAFLAQQ